MTKPVPKIGVFDSGIGGKSVANAIQESFPDHEVIYLDDHENMPYGNKSTEFIYNRALIKLNELQDMGVHIIVVACNTVTTNHISELREQISVPLIGVEPMVKPASRLTDSSVIAVCATTSTLKSPRYKQLKDTHLKNHKVIEPDCSQWAYMIENNKINNEHVRKQIDEACNAGADVIVLACTHYHWIEDIINEAADGRAIVIQPEQAIIQELQRQLDRL